MFIMLITTNINTTIYRIIQQKYMSTIVITTDFK